MRTCRYFILHREICRFSAQALSGEHSPAGDSYLLQNISIMNPPVGSTSLPRILIDHVEISLRLSTLQEEILMPFRSGYLPSLDDTRCDNLRARWNWIKKAIDRINKSKTRQRAFLAQIMSVDPWKSMLKKPLDPSQAGPRPNTAHIAARFEGNSEKSSRNTSIPKSFNGQCAYGIDLIELVPYDRYLGVFFKASEKYPPNSDLDASEQMQSMQLFLTPLSRRSRSLSDFGTSEMSEGCF